MPTSPFNPAQELVITNNGGAIVLKPQVPGPPVEYTAFLGASPYIQAMA